MQRNDPAAGAAVAPFASGTWEMQPTSEAWVPLTAAEKEKVAADMERTDNCQTLEDRLERKRGKGLEPSYVDDFIDRYRLSECRNSLMSLKLGGENRSYFSPLKYLAINLGSALSGFFSVFGLAYLLPALIRRAFKILQRYWGWLNT